MNLIRDKNNPIYPMHLRFSYRLIIHLNNRFQSSEVGVGELGEFFGDFFDGEAVGDPGLGVDFSFFDDFDDVAEVRREGVAGGEEGLLAAVEDGGVGEGEVLGGDADINDAGGEGSELETAGHGVVGASGIDDHVGEVAIGEVFEFFQMGAVLVELDALGEAEVVGAEVES